MKCTDAVTVSVMGKNRRESRENAADSILFTVVGRNIHYEKNCYHPHVISVLLWQHLNQSSYHINHIILVVLKRQNRLKD